MKTGKIKISRKKLNQIISQELKSLHENLDHESVKNIVTSASKFLKSIDDFQKSANNSMSDVTLSHTNELKQKLESMINDPASYVDRPVRQNKVSLKNVKKEEVL